MTVTDDIVCVIDAVKIFFAMINCVMKYQNNTAFIIIKNILLYNIMNIIPKEKFLFFITVEATSNSNFNTSFTWNNVNLRQIMGNTFYNKYKLFQLNFVCISHGISTNTIGSTSDDLNVIVRLKGLPFKNCNYNYLTNNKLNLLLL